MCIMLEFGYRIFQYNRDTEEATLEYFASIAAFPKFQL